MNNSDILAAITAASAAQKFSTLASLLWTLDLVDSPANVRSLRASLQALRAARSIKTTIVGNDVCYSV